ncbi:MAG: tRNA (guanosine(46)-N7)-methyltransferase TrmB, partial [Gammaproteobacteria bacterium]
MASINEPLRPIRSFVRREGRITGAQKEALETLQSAYGIDASRTIGKAYPFSHDTRIHLEIGFGDGETLIALAKACPEDGFIGIDPHRPGAGRLLLRLKQEQIDNVRVIVGDAAEQLPALIEPDSLSR